MQRMFMVISVILAWFPNASSASEFASDWKGQHDRVWLGASYWANPMEDWRIADGRADWRGADMKVVCSQTIFCNLANYHGGNQQFIFADLDSNGWPQTGRNRALAAMRRGFAFHYAGDQHLASIVHHGIDAWNDAGYSFCVPSIAAGYPRSWLPDKEGRPVQHRLHPELPNTGEYRDGFGNLMTVHAVGNPEQERRKPVLELLHDKASGYGIDWQDNSRHQRDVCSIRQSRTVCCRCAGTCGRRKLPG